MGRTKKILKKYKDISVDTMNKEQLSRWLALYEAINLISNKARRKEVNFNKLLLKSNAIEDYIYENSPEICKSLEKSNEDDIDLLKEKELI